jgi:hypothetical protein
MSAERTSVTVEDAGPKELIEADDANERGGKFKRAKKLGAKK